MSNIFFYEFELRLGEHRLTSDSVIVGGLLNADTTNAKDLLLAIRNDLVDRLGYPLDGFEYGRLLDIRRV